ncbi:MAG: alanine--tRNA ligase [endosymbiont of Galathealinum brachiosum]|uniref:Alanine--tRNA ligase n=1 Tax=endosymbiont of Galathealinum brachiosum TaxID=2200906 RepID=A0A370DFQ7_9GAMM|nr:MAG: alanine--tRNA ligase [endosymbiont of Galathealinum brachiosum]
MKTTAEIRQQFLDFFSSKGHEVVASSSLIPGNDPTLLFTNAGMVQFKDVFLGQDERSYVTATSSQRCVRAGGKHNDLENVGYTARHHTFFEMLGNFSFGDYFKREAINYAWEFLTEVCGLPKEKLWVTVYADDDEAAKIWLEEIGIDKNSFSRIGDKPGGKKNESDNFWSMGDTGPCGPCTEIFYDHGENIPGGPPGTPEEDGDRYIEIWNLVFMQYNRDKSGKMEPLPKPSVDTGMGLERLAAILQDGHSNYDIDLFQALIGAAAKETGFKDLTHSSLKVIADHIRSCSFLIVDGVLPSNEGRGYVLRRIIRRALRHGHKLGQNDLFFHKLVKPLVEQMGVAYPELKKAQKQVEDALKLEEKRFAETLDQGMKILEDSIESIKDGLIPGEMVFKLYDTYGFPVDLTADIARERELSLDMPGYEVAMEAQRERARSASKFGVDYNDSIDTDSVTEFTGYDLLKDQSEVVSLFKDGELVDSVSTGDDAIVVLKHTPFYAESGGQVGDTGLLVNDSAGFEVLDTKKQGKAFIHIGSVTKGELKVGESLSAEINTVRRDAIIRNHSATHLMHAALRSILGEHVQQKGSLCDDQRLRFDFSHNEAIKPDQLFEVERLVNQQIRSNLNTEAEEMAIADAKEKGAMALFGEKYGDEVRVVAMGGFSVELCGGVHVGSSGEIGSFKIVAESGIASGVRRIEAVTGIAAIEYSNNQSNKINKISSLLKASNDEIEDKLSQVLSKIKAQEKEIAQLKSKMATQTGKDLTADAVEIDGIKVLAVKLEGVDSKSLRDTMDQLKNKLGSAIIILATADDKKVSLCAGVTKDQTGRIKAGDLVNMVASQVGGKGGGRPDMAMAGGSQPENLQKALDSVTDWVEQQL